MGTWLKNSKSHISTMKKGDFFHNEKSTTIMEETTAKIEFISKKGLISLQKENISFGSGEVVDASFLSKKALNDFIHDQINDAKRKDVLFSLHLKATMMKVSDPIIFGHFVRVFYEPVLQKYKNIVTNMGINLNNGPLFHNGNSVSQKEGFHHIVSYENSGKRNLFFYFFDFFLEVASV